MASRSTTTIEVNPALDSEYNVRARVPDHAAILARWREDSAAFRSRTAAALDLRYGTLARHRMDLFRAPNARGTLVFIHGGFWRSLDKSDFSFVAAPFVDIGLSVAAINYRLCPAVSVSDIVADCRDALTWLLANGARHEMSVERIALSGHSAGAHLLAMLFATDWARRGIDAARIAGGVALSGLFDLEPLLQISLNADLRLSCAAEARTVSPARLAPTLGAQLYLSVGAEESAAFRQQTQSLHRAWPAVCSHADEVAGCNHFTILDHFAHPGSGAFHCIDQLFN